MASMERVLFLMKKKSLAASASLVAVYLPTFGRYVRHMGQESNYCRAQCLQHSHGRTYHSSTLMTDCFAVTPTRSVSIPFGGTNGEAYRAISTEMIDFVLTLRKKQSAQLR